MKNLGDRALIVHGQKKGQCRKYFRSAWRQAKSVRRPPRAMQEILPIACDNFEPGVKPDGLAVSGMRRLLPVQPERQSAIWPMF